MSERDDIRNAYNEQDILDAIIAYEQSDQPCDSPSHEHTGYLTRQAFRAIHGTYKSNTIIPGKLCDFATPRMSRIQDDYTTGKDDKVGITIGSRNYVSNYTDDDLPYYQTQFEELTELLHEYTDDQIEESGYLTHLNKQRLSALSIVRAIEAQRKQHHNKETMDLLLEGIRKEYIQHIGYCELADKNGEIFEHDPNKEGQTTLTRIALHPADTNEFLDAVYGLAAQRDLIQDSTARKDGNGTPMLQIVSYEEQHNQRSRNIVTDDIRIPMRNLGANIPVHNPKEDVKRLLNEVASAHRNIQTSITASTFLGNSRKQNRLAATLAIVADIDDVAPELLYNNLTTVIGINGKMPVPTAIVTTCSGLHFWYALTVPVRYNGRNGLGSSLKAGVNSIQRAVTNALYKLLTYDDNETSNNLHSEDHSLAMNQGYAIPGSMTKQYKPAFKTGRNMRGNIIQTNNAHIIKADYLCTFLKGERDNSMYDCTITTSIQQFLDAKLVRDELDATGTHLPDNGTLKTTIDYQAKVFLGDKRLGCESINNLAMLTDYEAMKTAGELARDWLLPGKDGNVKHAVTREYEDLTPHDMQEARETLLLLTISRESVWSKLLWYIGEKNNLTLGNITWLVEKNENAITNGTFKGEITPLTGIPDMLSVIARNKPMDPTEWKKGQGRKHLAELADKATKAQQRRTGAAGDMPSDIFATWVLYGKLTKMGHHRRVRWRRFVADLEQVKPGRRYLSLVELKKASLICGIAPTDVWSAAISLQEKWNEFATSTGAEPLYDTDIRSALIVNKDEADEKFSWEVAYRIAGIKSLYGGLVQAVSEDRAEVLGKHNKRAARKTVREMSYPVLALQEMLSSTVESSYDSDSKSASFENIANMLGNCDIRRSIAEKSRTEKALEKIIHGMDNKPSTRTIQRWRADFIKPDKSASKRARKREKSSKSSCTNRAQALLAMTLTFSDLTAALNHGVAVPETGCFTRTTRTRQDHISISKPEPDSLTATMLAGINSNFSTHKAVTRFGIITEIVPQASASMKSIQSILDMLNEMLVDEFIRFDICNGYDKRTYDKKAYTHSSPQYITNALWDEYKKRTPVKHSNVYNKNSAVSLLGRSKTSNLNTRTNTMDWSDINTHKTNREGNSEIIEYSTDWENKRSAGHHRVTYIYNPSYNKKENVIGCYESSGKHDRTHGSNGAKAHSSPPEAPPATSPKTPKTRARLTENC